MRINDVAFDPDLGAGCRFGPDPDCPSPAAVRTTRIGEYNGVAVGGDTAFAVWTGNTATGQQTIFDAFPCQPMPDHFKCYRANAPGVTRTVSLADQFGSSTVTVRKPNRFCNPVDKNGEGITDPTGHLMCHKIKGPRFAPRDVVVRNQFGDQTIHVVRPETLCNPAEKDGVPLSSVAGAFLDHFQCYRAVGRGFIRRTVSLGDQFFTVQTTVLKPAQLCNPVDKNGSGIKRPQVHLACYRIKDAQKFPANDVTVEDQFGTFFIRARQGGCHKPTLLCLPSEKNPAAPATTTITTTTSTSSTTTTTVRQTLCCDVPPGALGNPVPVCLDAVAPDVGIKCQLLGGVLSPGICDPDTERCVAPQAVPPNDFCCECPVPSPPFPHAAVCFEGVTGHESKCQPPCVLIPGVACGPVSEECGGSPSGAFLEPTGP